MKIVRFSSEYSRVCVAHQYTLTVLLDGEHYSATEMVRDDATLPREYILGMLTKAIARVVEKKLSAMLA